MLAPGKLLGNSSGSWETPGYREQLWLTTQGEAHTTLPHTLQGELPPRESPPADCTWCGMWYVKGGSEAVPGVLLGSSSAGPTDCAVPVDSGQQLAI